MAECAAEIIHVSVTTQGVVLTPDIFHVGPVIQIRLALFEIVLVSLQEPVPQHRLHGQAHRLVGLDLQADKADKPGEETGNPEDTHPVVNCHMVEPPSDDLRMQQSTKTGHTNINNQTTEGAKLSLYCFGVRYPSE